MQGNMAEVIKPLLWLIGKWKSINANGKYPTIKPFTYKEELEFKAIGQPMLNYTSYTEHPEKKVPMHLESGHLRIKPGTNEVALLLAHNFGITTIEEGCVDEKALTMELKTTSISRIAFANPSIVTELTRSYRFCSDTNHLELIVCMATTKTPLTEHLRVSYVKC